MVCFCNHALFFLILFVIPPSLIVAQAGPISYYCTANVPEGIISFDAFRYIFINESDKGVSISLVFCEYIVISTSDESYLFGVLPQNIIQVSTGHLIMTAQLGDRGPPCMLSGRSAVVNVYCRGIATCPDGSSCIYSSSVEACLCNGGITFLTPARCLAEVAIMVTCPEPVPMALDIPYVPATVTIICTVIVTILMIISSLYCVIK